jgi:hypothetical protein
MTSKPPAKLPNPKSADGQARSAEALRANLLKRKAQTRARENSAPKPPKGQNPG